MCPQKRRSTNGKKRKRSNWRLNSAQKELVAGCLNKPHHGQDVHDGASTAQPLQKSQDFVNKRRKKKSKSSLKGVSHPSPKRRRIGANLRFWLWRNWKKVRCRRLWWSSVSGRRKVQSRLNRLNARRRPRKRNEEVERHCSQDQRELSERTVALAEDRPVKENSLLDPTTSTPEVRAESLTTIDVRRNSTAVGQSGLNKTGHADGKDTSVQFCEQSTSSPVLSSCNDSQTQQVHSVDRGIIIRPVNEKAPKELLLSPESHGEASPCTEQLTATLTLWEPNTDTHTGGTSVPCKKARRKKRNGEVEWHCSQDQRELSERTVALAEDRPVKENSLLGLTTTSTPDQVRADSSETTTDIRRSVAAGQSGLNKMEQADGKDRYVQFCEQSTSSPAPSSCNDSQTLQVRSVDRGIIIRPVNEKAPKELLLSPERHGEASRRPEQRTANLTFQEPNTDTHTGGKGVPCKKARLKKRNGEVEWHCSQDQRELSERTVALAEDRPVKENSLLDPTTTSTPEVRAESLMTTDISSSAATGQSGQNKTGQADGKDCSVRLCKRTGSTAPSSCNDSQTVKVRSVDRDIIIRHGEASRRPVERTVTLTLREPNTDTHTGGTSAPCKKARRKKEPSPAAQCGTEELKKEIHEFLDGFYRRYGSFFALQRTDTLSHLKSKFRMDSNESQLRKNWVCMVAAAHQVDVMRRPDPDFQVVYKKHLLTLEDLSSLERDNWLNDQVINMYGEMIMESSRHKVHFFNSFFHRQLINKGYEGVRRWTKQVDVFSKQLLLVPVHLDVHWCLVAVDTVEKRLHLYDSQGTVFKRVARDVMNYLRMEAKERRQTTLQKDWTMSVKGGIPQQTNENDCGVFVLEYCRCLALGKPLDFSQNHIPRVRRRIYKELCDCKIQED